MLFRIFMQEGSISEKLQYLVYCDNELRAAEL